MTDHRPIAFGSGPDDPFERTLRSVLHDRAAGPVPASLTAALDEVVRGPVARPAGRARRTVLGILAAAAGLLLLALAVNPISTLMQAVLPVAATPTAPAMALQASPSASPSLGAGPSASPAAHGIDWSGDGVTFTADAIHLALTDDGDVTVPANLAPTRIPIRPGVVDLRWEWMEQSRNRLVIRVESDGDHWSVPEIGYQNVLYDDQMRLFTDLPIEGSVGTPWSGDVRRSVTVPPYQPSRLRIDNLVFEPGITAEDLAGPSPALVEARPFTIDNGHVLLAADSLELSWRGETLHGPAFSGGSKPATTTLWRDQLDANWSDGTTSVRLWLDFRTDGDRWWATDGSVYADGFGQGRLDVEAFTAPRGQPFVGDIDVRLPWAESDQTGERMRLVIKNLSLEPFRGTMPRTLTGCRPVIDPATTSWKMDPTRSGQPLAANGIVGLPTEKAAGVLEDLGYCYLFDRRLTPDPSLGPSGILEIWCVPPPGEVAGLRYGKGGEIHLIVLTEVPKGTPKRSQPILGFGCQDGVPLPSDPPPLTPTPDATHEPLAPMSAKAYVWDTGEVRVAADDVTLTIGDQVFHPQPGSRGGSPDVRDGGPQITLFLDDAHTNARLSFTSDGTRWSLHSVDVYGGGTVNNVPISVADLGAPLGENVTGDVQIVGTALTRSGRVDVRLDLTGAEIAAYRPAVARTLRDCQPLSAITSTGDNLVAPGQPLDGLGLIGAPARKAAAAMEALGYCYRFGFRPVDFSNDNNWYETWCDAPPGKVRRVTMGENGEARFEVVTDQPHEDRAQPPVGWGCLSDVPGYASPAP